MRIESEVPETLEAITRPIAFGITRQVGELMHLPSVTEILFNGPGDQALQPGSALNYQGAPAKFPGESRISVDMSESFDDSVTMAESSLQEEAPLLFLDSGLGLRLRTVYANAYLTLTFNVRSRSRTEAQKIHDEFRQRAAMGREMILHTATYHYGLPANMMELMQAIYAMREAVAGYGDTFEDWLKQHASRRLTQISTLDGAQNQWVFGETQVGIQGRFNFQVQPEAPDRSDPEGKYNFPFEYTIQYNRPYKISADYQLINHSQLIPEKYRSPVVAGYDQRNPFDSQPYGSKSTNVWNELFNNKKLKPCLIDGVRTPVFDDWLPARVPSMTSSVYVTIIVPNPSDFNEVVDLKTLDGVTIDPDILQYMASQATQLGVINGAAVHVELYKNQSWMGDDAITVSSDLIVRSVDPLCQRDRYHLRISILNDLLRLSDSARQALCLQGRACQKLLCTMQAGMPYSSYVPKLVGPGLVPDNLFVDAAIRINKHKRAYFTGLEHQMLTVGNFLISTKRLNTYAPATNAGPEPAGPTLNNDPRYQSGVSDGCQ